MIFQDLKFKGKEKVKVKSEVVRFQRRTFPFHLRLTFQSIRLVLDLKIMSILSMSLDLNLRESAPSADKVLDIC